MNTKFYGIILLSMLTSASPFGSMGPAGVPQTFKNCKAGISQGGPYTGYGCSNYPYVCNDGIYPQVGPPGRQRGPYLAGGPFGMPEASYSGYGMTGFPGPGGLMDQFGNPAFGYDYGYGQDMGYSPPAYGSRRGHGSKRESCSGNECEDDEKSEDSGKNSSGSSS
ncbi:hypothetical protein Aperf_G00000038743 [Anoplocephala perfoliata]